jgi:hypothetical protein
LDDVFTGADLQVYKNPNAVILGRQKLGCKEIPSMEKRLSCHRNGVKPRSGQPRSGTPERIMICPLCLGDKRENGNLLDLPVRFQDFLDLLAQDTLKVPGQASANFPSQLVKIRAE